MASNDNKKLRNGAFKYVMEHDDFSAPLSEAVGSALSSWAILEMQLSVVYLTLAHPTGFPLGAPAAFASIASFEVRLRMIGTFLGNSLESNDLRHQAVMSSWNSISNKLHKLNKKRNELAHGVSGEFKGYPSIKDQRGWMPFYNFSSVLLTVNPQRNATTSAKKVKVLSLKDIREFEGRVSEMYHRLSGYANDDLRPVAQTLELIELPTLK